ncbi:MAG: prephenate dehydratase [Pseudomonadota bacterium]
MKVAFQGEPGANSHIACQEVFPNAEALPCPTFEDAFAAVTSGRAAHAMIPIENSVAGRVADIHHIMPGSNLHIVDEHFLRVRHQLLGLKGATLATLKTVHSHVQALGQCRETLQSYKLTPIVAADTAGSAREISEAGDLTRGAIATSLAADIYGLEILAADVEDASHNTTRFIILSPEEKRAEPDGDNVITTFVFRVRNLPAALYKALGGFATNGVNMMKLESYQLEGQFFASQFYADVIGHPDDEAVGRALDELAFFCSEFRILGVYRAHPFRRNILELDAQAK